MHPPSSLTDEELCRRVVDGERDLFAEIVRRYQDTVFRLSLRSVGNHHDAEEIAQEVFLRAYRALPHFRGASRFSTWLTRIALNQINSTFSSKHSRLKSRCDLFDSDRHGGVSNPDSMESTAMAERIVVATASLKPLFREVLMLCGFEGRSYEDVAEVLGIPIGTVRSRLNAARIELRKIMASDLS